MLWERKGKGDEGKAKERKGKGRRGRQGCGVVRVPCFGRAGVFFVSKGLCLPVCLFRGLCVLNLLDSVCVCQLGEAAEEEEEEGTEECKTIHHPVSLLFLLSLLLLLLSPPLHSSPPSPEPRRL